jgi:uncharacterized protein YbjT (DUF2867 family)
MNTRSAIRSEILATRLEQVKRWCGSLRLVSCYVTVPLFACTEVKSLHCHLTAPGRCPPDTMASAFAMHGSGSRSGGTTVYLVLGAGGFIGLRLVAALVARGDRVRGLVRSQRATEAVARLGGEPVVGDLLQPESLPKAFAGATCVYYLVHGMAGGNGFELRDAVAIDNAIRAVDGEAVARFVYVSGLGARENVPSRHLRSRFEVEERLRASSLHYTILRAASVLGKGGASFEVMCDVVRGMPVIPLLNWRRVRTQPIGIDDLVQYLVDAPRIERTACATFDVGCREIVTYEELLRKIASFGKVRNAHVIVPGWWPRSSALALRFVSSVPPHVVRALIPGLRVEMVCENRAVDACFDFVPIPLDEALQRALDE